MDERIKHLETKVSWSKDNIEGLNFPKDVLEKLPCEVRKTVEGVMSNYRNDFPDFCFWGIRKALIDAIRIRFKRDGKEGKLYDHEGNAYKLHTWIDLAKQERYISRDNAKILKSHVKVFGDTASHDYMVDLHKEEVPPVFSHLRIALARMYYEEKSQ